MANLSGMNAFVFDRTPTRCRSRGQTGRRILLLVGEFDDLVGDLEIEFARIELFAKQRQRITAEEHFSGFEDLVAPDRGKPAALATEAPPPQHQVVEYRTHC